MAKKNRFFGSKIYAYVRSRLGYAAQHKKSIFELTCLALAKDGIPKPDNVKHDDWVRVNAQYILEAIKTITPVKKKPYVFRTNIQIAEELNKPKNKKAREKTTLEIDVSSRDFLSSFAWRQLRMQALKLYGARCQCCGASPATGAVMNVDHIKPRKLFPSLALELSNLQVLCHECNHGKGNWDQTDWRCTK